MSAPDSSDSSKKRGAGSSGDDEGALWAHVVSDVKPLKNAGDTVPAPQASAKAVKIKSAIAQIPPLPPKKSRTPGDQEVDRRTDQKLKRGQYPVDVTLDLHGLTQVAAHKKLLETLKRGYARDLRCVLVITGKGRGEGQGVLRRQVPEWLSDESLRSIVLRFHAAQPEHGGAGALYVLLRRKRTDD